jgi:mRNA interferase RelE/StbE
LAWTIDFDSRAVKQLEKLDRSAARRIRDYLQQRVAPLDDPRQLGAALKGSEFGTFWRYRIGDYRVICDIQDDRLVVLVVSVGNRRDIYR